MADQGREALELVIGTVMAQSAVVEYLVKAGVIESAPLLEHLARKRVAWEKSATALALFPVDVLASILAGRQPPPPPGSMH